MQKTNDQVEKTESQLTEELGAMRMRVAELEAAIAELKKHKPNHTGGFVVRSPRVEIRTDIEFIADFDIVEARGVNISETGICFELSENLPFEIQFRIDGKLHRHRAYLVWAKRISEGGYRFGLEFVHPEPEPTF